MVITIKYTKEPIYFVKYLSINKIECIVVNFYENNKIKLFDLFDKVKIKIKKIIDKSSDEGKYILYNLGYIDSYDKIILKCTVKIKLNKKINNILFIIINHCVSMTLDKYIIHDNNYTYDSSLMEDKENLFC
jgi:hypothetical protein